MMWQPRSRGVYIGVGDDDQFTVRSSSADIAVGDLQLIAGIALDAEQWNILLVPDMWYDGLYVPAHRRNIYVGARMARWIAQQDLHTLLTVLLDTANDEGVIAGLDVLGQAKPYRDSGPRGEILVVEYDPQRDWTTARRERDLPWAGNEFELQGCKVTEALAGTIDYGVAITEGDVVFGAHVTDSGDVSLQERVTDVALQVAKGGPSQAQAALLSHVQDLFTKGGAVTKRQVRDVSQYGPDLGFSTEREKPADPFAAVEAALQSLLVQAASVNAAGRNDRHVLLFMERVGEIEGQIDDLDDRLAGLRTQLDLARIAVGKQVMGASQ